jgi:hypothetical protein
MIPLGVRDEVRDDKGIWKGDLKIAPARIRTLDPLIKSQLLYQLSYWCGYFAIRRGAGAMELS